MIVEDLLDEDKDSLINLYLESRESSRWIKSQYNKMIQELIDEGYDIDELMGNN